MSEEMKRPVLTLADVGIGENDVAQGIPTGGISFGASTFIGPWQMRLIYTVATEEEPEGVLKDTPITVTRDGEETEVSCWPPISVNEGNGWYFLTYHDFGVAVQAGALLNEKPRRPDTSIQYFMKTADVMNEANLERLSNAFGETLMFSVLIKSLVHSENFPGNKRHAFQLIGLTSAVAASAAAFGKPEIEPFDLSELVSLEFDREDDDYTDELRNLLVGDPEAGMFAPVEVDFDDPQVAKIMLSLGVEPPESDEEVIEIVPILAQRRQELWSLLGEENFKAYTPSGTTRPSGGDADTNVTKGTSLDQCVRFMSNGWQIPIYARVTLVPDPRPNAMSKSGNRISVPALTEVFGVGEQGKTYAANIAADELDGQEVIKPVGWPQKPQGWLSTDNRDILDFMRKNDPGNEMPVDTAVVALYMDNAELLAEWRAMEEKTRA